MEQLQYQKEQIEWSFIEFPDNQDCLVYNSDNIKCYLGSKCKRQIKVLEQHNLHAFVVFRIAIFDFPIEKSSIALLIPCCSFFFGDYCHGLRSL
jgi:hypothetical protein